SADEVARLEEPYVPHRVSVSSSRLSCSIGSGAARGARSLGQPEGTDTARGTEHAVADVDRPIDDRRARRHGVGHRYRREARADRRVVDIEHVRRERAHDDESAAGADAAPRRADLVLPHGRAVDGAERHQVLGRRRQTGYEIIQRGDEVVGHEPDAAIEEPEPGEGRSDRLRRHGARPYPDPSPGSPRYSEPSLLPETTSSRVPPRPSSACTTSGPFRKPKSWWAIVWVQGPVTKAQSAELRHSIDPSLAHAPNCSGGSTRVFQTTVPLAASI